MKKQIPSGACDAISYTCAARPGIDDYRRSRECRLGTLRANHLDHPSVWRGSAEQL